MHCVRSHGCDKSSYAMTISIALRYSRDLIISVRVALANNNVRTDNCQDKYRDKRARLHSHSRNFAFASLRRSSRSFVPRKCSTTLVLRGRRIDLSGLPEKSRQRETRAHVGNAADEIVLTHNRMMYCSLSQVEDGLSFFLSLSLPLSSIVCLV